MAANSPTPVLSITALNIYYQGKQNPAVKHLSLELPLGQITCLLGPSGCGKTSLLRAIAGFVPSATGSITLAGEVLNDEHTQMPAQLRQIGFMFQDLALFQHLTIQDNIAFGLSTQQFKRTHANFDVGSRVAQVMQLTHIADLAHRYPNELSGGQQQRVALARALAPMPKLLLLDEPFSSLDAHMRRELAYEVKHILKNQNITALMVTHDQQEAFAMADTIGVMHHGQLEQLDTPYKLYHQPTTRFVAQFIGEGVFLPHTVFIDTFKRDNLSQIPRNTPETQVSIMPNTLNTDKHVLDVLLRPDDIVHDDNSKMTAKVLHKTFRGSDFLYTLQLNSGHTVLALVPSHHDHPIDAWIGIQLEADHLITFATP